MPPDLAAFATRALACIGQELPSWSERIAAATPTPLTIASAGYEPFGVVSAADGLQVATAPAQARLTIVLGPGTADRLIKGNATIAGAVDDGSLDVVGPAQDFIDLEHAFHLFVLATARTLGIDRIADDWNQL